MPLVRPYRLSYRTFEAFEPYLVEVVTDEGEGFGDGHISPGSSDETREGGWRFLENLIPQLVGGRVDEALERAIAAAPASKVAASALVTALEHANGIPLLQVDEDHRLPLLAPVNALVPAEIAAEIEDGVAAGFRTFKVKVGKDVAADLTRVAAIQEAAVGRATLRLDANRGYSRDDALRFVRGLRPDGIELFEQPCAAEDWEGNAAVAAASPVPLMLDEPICAAEDIERAAEIAGVGFCKLKLKRFVSLAELERCLNLVRECAMEPVLGDGLGSEVTSWMEACVARQTIGNAGEFNGFLKPVDRLFEKPLAFRDGALELAAGPPPCLDRDAVDRLTVDLLRFE